MALVTDSAHAHCFVPGTGAAMPPLIMLHGSGGNEFDLIKMGSELAPGVVKLGVRGTVDIDGGYAFFRRFPDRRVDELDIAARAPVLATFVDVTCKRYGLVRRPIAVGFSNGAIMAAALLLTHPGLLAAAVLFRPLSPFTYDLPHRIDGTPVLIVDGEEDSRRSPGDGMRLAERLECAGAMVTHHVVPVGHSISTEDKRIARDWLKTSIGTT